MNQSDINSYNQGYRRGKRWLAGKSLASIEAALRGFAKHCDDHGHDLVELGTRNALADYMRRCDAIEH